MRPMDALANNWPAILVALAVALVVLGVLRKLIKLAFFGATVGVIALFIWPLVAERT